MASKKISPKKVISSRGKIQEQASAKSVSKSPLVFISHDTRDAELAEAFSQLLTSPSMEMSEPFRSSDKKAPRELNMEHFGTKRY